MGCPVAIAFNVKLLRWFKITKFFKNMNEIRCVSVYWAHSQVNVVNTWMDPHAGDEIQTY